MRAWRAWLRSVNGQLSLFAATFAAALVLALLIVALRGVVFERFVRELYLPAEGWSEEVVKTLAAPLTRSHRLEEIGKEMQGRIDRATEPVQAYQDLERIYGAWMRGDATDEAGNLPRRLTKMQPEWVISRLRRTLAAGSAMQRGRALDWLDAIMSEPDRDDRVLQLAEYAQRRASACGERELERRAESVVAKGRRDRGAG